MLEKSETLLRLDEVKARTALGRSTLYSLIARSEFPRPVHIRGTRIAAWRESAVDAWIASQFAGVA